MEDIKAAYELAKVVLAVIGFVYTVVVIKDIFFGRGK